MTLFVALVGVSTFVYLAHQYLITESRLPELLERYRSLGRVADDSMARYHTDHESLPGERGRRERPALWIRSL